MKKSVILNIGTEIIKGEIKETNSFFIAKNLKILNISVEKIITVEDDLQNIVSTIKGIITEQKIDYLIISGGIGPTEDDLTREAISQVLNIKLKFSRKEWEYLQDTRIRKLKKKNKLCYFPARSRVLRSIYKTASAFLVEQDKIKIFILPGVPYEMKYLLQKRIIPFLKKENKKSKNLDLTIKIFGYREKFVNNFVKKLLKNEKIHWGILSRNDGVWIKFYFENTLKINTLKERRAILIQQFKTYFKDAIYSCNGNTMLKEVENLIFSKKVKISTVESCTSGLVGVFLNKIKNISKYYMGSVVPYTKEAKLNITKIDPNIIQETSVNKETVIHLAEWGLNLFNSEICLSISGNLGPKKEREADPKVGIVYFCLFSKKNPIRQIEKKYFLGNREIIRKKAVFFALNMLRLFLKRDKS